jgi:hypothetical protein
MNSHEAQLVPLERFDTEPVKLAREAQRLREKRQSQQVKLVNVQALLGAPTPPRTNQMRSHTVASWPHGIQSAANGILAPSGTQSQALGNPFDRRVSGD